MSKYALMEGRVHAGVWQGLVVNDGEDSPAPAIEVIHAGEALAGVTIAQAPNAPGSWVVAAPIPAEVLFDGVQVFLVRERGKDETLGHFTILTGSAIEQDMVAEIHLLRAELDMLKRVFRRHYQQTGV